MSTREGNLEAPTRHLLDWKNPASYDTDASFTEMERAFDICHSCHICHSCRRWVSLCQSLPNRFDLVDATEGGEVHRVKAEAYWKVIDQCHLCARCSMTNCPMAGHHIAQGMTAAGTPPKAVQHLLSLVRIAYGLE